MVGDGGDGFAAGLAGAGDCEGVVVDGDGAASPSALGCCGGEAVEGASLNEVAFHLGCHGGDHEQHLVGNGLPVGFVEAGADTGEDLQVHRFRDPASALPQASPEAPPGRLRARVRNGVTSRKSPAGEGGTHGRCTGGQRPGRRVPGRAYSHGCEYFNGYCIEPG